MGADVRRGMPAELVTRLRAFEDHFGMSTADFVAMYELDEDVPGVHPHIVGLWYGAHLMLQRVQSYDLESLEEMLA